MVISKAKGRFYSAGKVAAPAWKEIADRVYATKIKGTIEADTPEPSPNAKEYQPVTDPLQYDPKRVPDVKGMNISDAVYVLESMGWNTTFEGYGQVIQQSVPAGDSLRAGGLITLTLAKK